MSEEINGDFLLEKESKVGCIDEVHLQKYLHPNPQQKRSVF